MCSDIAVVQWLIRDAQRLRIAVAMWMRSVRAELDSKRSCAKQVRIVLRVLVAWSMLTRGTRAEVALDAEHSSAKTLAEQLASTAADLAATRTLVELASNEREQLELIQGAALPQPT